MGEVRFHFEIKMFVKEIFNKSMHAEWPSFVNLFIASILTKNICLKLKFLIFIN